MFCYQLTTVKDSENIHTIFNLKTTKNCTSQSYLSDLLVKNRKQNFIDSITDNAYLCWLTSLATGESGKWLDAIPKYNNTTFSNSNLSSMYSLRLYTNQSCVHVGIRCNCAKKTLVDPLGHHFISGCHKDGMIKRQHDNLVHEFKRLFEWAGLQTIREEHCMLIHYIPKHTTIHSTILLLKLQPYNKRRALLLYAD
jgi:hypothetical protein